jgi:hypothetical protein
MPSGSTEWREFVAVVLLSITAIVTAWSGFQASKWGGAMSIAFSQASTARIEASRHEANANSQVTIQVSLFTQWLQAYQNKDKELTEFLQERFPEPLATAFAAWVATKPAQNADAPATPFAMPEYQLEERQLAQESDQRADSKYQEALRNNQRGDNYTILTVAFAAVLFFGAISGRMRSLPAQWAMLGIGIIGFVVASSFLITFPKLV